MARRSTAQGVARSMAGLLAMLAASTGALALLGLRLRTVAPAAIEAAQTARVETWIELMVLVAGLAGAAWTLLGTVAALAGIAAVRRGRPGRTAETVVGRWAPEVVRRLARGALGAGLGAGLVLAPGAALADEGSAPADEPGVVLQLGWESTADTATPEPAVADALPDPPEPAGSDAGGAAVPVSSTDTGAEQTVDPAEPADDMSPAVSSAQRTSHQDDDGADEVVVKRGDTLWAIAARTLPGDASAADVMRAVASWHDTNREVIGDDPDLILPGQVLRAP